MADRYFKNPPRKITNPGRNSPNVDVEQAELNFRAAELNGEFRKWSLRVSGSGQALVAIMVLIVLFSSTPFLPKAFNYLGVHFPVHVASLIDRTAVISFLTAVAGAGFAFYSKLKIDAALRDIENTLDAARRNQKGQSVSIPRDPADQ